MERDTSELGFWKGKGKLGDQREKPNRREPVRGCLAAESALGWWLRGRWVKMDQ